MIGRRLINGSETGGIAADDRGLQYGDGLFETMAATGGRIRNLELHMARLAEGCRRLLMPVPSSGIIEDECARVLEGMGSGTVKLTLTRGPGPRDYRPPAEPSLTRIVVSSAAKPRGDALPPLVVRMCETRMGLNPALAGLKHLNRLEQVLACAEWDDPDIGEGLMLSADGRLVSATAANVFLVEAGRLVTPDIRDCGVAGVMRQFVLASAAAMNLPVSVEDVRPDRLNQADEVFVTNAIVGVRPVVELAGGRRWVTGAITRALMASAA